MKTKLFALSAFAGAAALLGSFALAAPDKKASADSPPANASEYAKKEHDEKFLKAAYSGNMLEIKLSQYALDQVKEHKDIRTLAEMLVKHHEEGKAKVAEAAKKSGVTLSEELLPAHKAKLEMAMECKGEVYHVPYLFCLASSHVEGILCVSHRMSYTQDANVKEYCAFILPVMKSHFAKIKPMAEDEAKVTDMTK